MTVRMKRFTRPRKNDNYHVTSPINVRRDYREDFTGPAVEQLAAYEDTGLTPGEVRVLQGRVVTLQTEQEILLRRVRDLERDNAAVRSECEYFRSRAEFFRGVAGGGVK